MPKKGTLCTKYLILFKILENTNCFIVIRRTWVVVWVFSSVQLNHPFMSDSLQPHGLQHARPPRPSPTPGVYPNSCPLSWWCHPTISSSVIPFSSCLQCFPASGSFPRSHFFVSGSQNIRVSASTSVWGLGKGLSRGMKTYCNLKILSWLWWRFHRYVVVQ